MKRHFYTTVTSDCDFVTCGVYIVKMKNTSPKSQMLTHLTLLAVQNYRTVLVSIHIGSMM